MSAFFSGTSKYWCFPKVVAPEIYILLEGLYHFQIHVYFVDVRNGSTCRQFCFGQCIVVLRQQVVCRFRGAVSHFTRPDGVPLTLCQF